MIKENITDGFVISLHQPELSFQSSPWGVHVDVIDFDRLPDGLLSVVVKASQFGMLSKMAYDGEELRHAVFSPTVHWPKQCPSELSTQLSEHLQHLMTNNKVFGQLYLTPYYNALPQWQSPTWVVSRWLEILPLSYQSRSKFIAEDSFKLAQNYIETMVLGLQNSTTINSN
jgi:uncharacterized protein